MGANLQTRSLDTKIQTQAAVREAFVEMQREARFEAESEGLDAGYTGMWDSCRGLRIDERVFDTFEQATDYISNAIDDGALAVRIRTIKDSKAMATARAALNVHVSSTWRLVKGSADYKAAARKTTALRKRLDNVTMSAVKRSKATHYVIAGWCKE